ncbi:MAG: S46 family peptidase [Candidatus Aminicenantes bacterium]|nr:S46 family peptidase [Candidatus Aminicenantes bacterium]
MKSKIIFLSIIFAIWPLAAKEGMHKVDGVTPAIAKDMKGCGFELDPASIWDIGKKSLAMAVVNLGGGTGSFVSADGLIITNHHVAFGAVQSLSSPEHNYIRDGFLARSRAEEIPAPGYNVRIMTGFVDATPQFQAIFRPGLDPKKRSRLIDKISKRLVRQGESTPGNECLVAQFYGGREFYLVTYLKIKDMRVVYVPARSVGEYGGEIDNWTWPRHTGDFSFLRAYVGRDNRPAEFAKDNVPYHPLHYFPIARQNLKAGDFTMIMGFPGTTKRWTSAAEVGNETEANYPQRIALLEQYIALLEKASAADEAVKIKNAGNLKGLYNSIKNYRGMLEGLRKNAVHETKLATEKQLAAFIASRPDLRKKYGRLLADISALAAEERQSNSLQTVYGWMTRGCRLFDWALTIDKWSREKAKKDLERETGYMERDIAAKKERLPVSQRNLDLGTDQAVFAFFLKKLLQADSANSFKTLRQEVEKSPGSGLDEQIAAFVNALYRHTRLADYDFKMSLFAADRKALTGTADAFIALADKIRPNIDAFTNRRNILTSRWQGLKPLYIEAMMQMRPADLFYPDANSTLRFNYGRVEGYSPRDAVSYAPFTTLAGVLEKNSGEFPFNLDAKFVAAAMNADHGAYVAPELNDVPVNFLTSNDSTGGNSGSPVLNSRGELVGVLFDGNYESLSSDFFYRPDITRSIHVDIRYVLFVADKVNQAGNVLEELAGR